MVTGCSLPYSQQPTTVPLLMQASLVNPVHQYLRLGLPSVSFLQATPPEIRYIANINNNNNNNNNNNRMFIFTVR
jgi:hypothetical protein